MKGSFFYKDFGGKALNVPVIGLDAATVTSVKMGTAATALQPYSNAAIVGTNILKPDLQVVGAGVSPVSDDYDSSFHKGIISFKYVEDNQQKTAVLYIPAPRVAAFEHVAEVGYRLTGVNGTELAAAFSTAAGKTFEFSDGKLEYREGRSAMPSEGAFIKWEDYNHRMQYMGVPFVTDKALLVTFAGLISQGDTLLLSALTTCAERQVGIITPEATAIAATATQAAGYDSVALKAILKFSWVASLKKHFMQMLIPAPKKTLFTTASQASKRHIVAPAAGAIIATALTTLYGSTFRTLMFEGGYCDYQNYQQ